MGAHGKGEWGVQKDSQGRVTAVKLDRHVLDPTSPEAVQIPAESLPNDDNSISDSYADVDTEDL